jgi:transcriptional regulator with XRE-family HTH domain
MALQDLMASAGLSQRQFANLIPCSQGQLHKWLDGSRKLNLVALERIAMALNVPPSYFVEYRAMKFADLISSHFLKNPNASITVAKALAKK